jgi:F-type H+-transporting ATPase subunit b
MDMEMLHNPLFWVTVAFVILILASYKKGSAMLTGTLDSRSARIAAELTQARQLREEAEAILAEYKRRQGEYMKEAKAILDNAGKDADAMAAYTEKELRDALDARMKQALEKIAQEETKAIADVRNHVVDISLAAARSIIVDHVSTLSQDELIKLALSDIERKIH